MEKQILKIVGILAIGFVAFLTLESFAFHTKPVQAWTILATAPTGADEYHVIVDDGEDTNRYSKVPNSIGEQLEAGDILYVKAPVGRISGWEYGPNRDYSFMPFQD